MHQMLKVTHPAKPQSVVGEFNASNGIDLAWDAVEGAGSYVVHYGNANVTDPKQMIFMGYSATPSWTLDETNVPAMEDGDTITLAVMAYNEVGQGANDVEKAAWLNTNGHGSAWSELVTLTKASAPK